MIWANEIFDNSSPDTLPIKYEKIEKNLIVTIVGTRPEIIRLSRVISVLDKYCDHMVHTGRNYDYELNEIFFNELKINKPKFF